MAGVAPVRFMKPMLSWLAEDRSIVCAGAAGARWIAAPVRDAPIYGGGGELRLMRRYARLANGFSRKFENLEAAVALNYFVYSVIRNHQNAVCHTSDGGWRD
jgi:hypothetical protein